MQAGLTQHLMYALAALAVTFVCAWVW